VTRAEPTLSALMVTWNERELVERCLPPLVAQLRPGDELIVADNGSSDGTADTVARLAPSATIVRLPENLGRMAGCNAAAAEATGDLLLVLDADATVADGFIEAIRRPAVEDRGWSAWMGVVTMDQGRLINTSAGVSHFTGISWTRQIGEPVDQAPSEPEEDVGFVTGVCLTTTREAWERTPWFSPEYFLYFDDADYSWRVRLAGGRLGVEPSARVDHLYDFRRARPKWRMLERNRWASLIRVYPAELLALVAPALLATEVAVMLASVRGGWAGEKLLSWRDVIAWLPRLLRERRAIQASRTVSAAEFARTLTPDLSSPYLGAAGRSRLLRTLLRAYWRGVRLVLAR
jgi:GT2 family glycosyltransferase